MGKSPRQSEARSCEDVRLCAGQEGTGAAAGRMGTRWSPGPGPLANPQPREHTGRAEPPHRAGPSAAHSMAQSQRRGSPTCQILALGCRRK